MDAGIEVVRRADQRLHRLVAAVHQDRRGVAHTKLAPVVDKLADQLFQALLQAWIEGAVQFVVSVAGQQLLAQVRRAEGQLAPGARLQRQLQQAVVARIVGMLAAPLGHQLQARALQRRAELAAARLLGNHRQGQGLAERKLRRRLAEIDAAGRLDTLDVAAHGRQVEIGLKDVVLAVACLDPQRQGDLLQLAGNLPRVEVVQAPGELHTQGRATLAHTAAIGGHSRAHQCRGVDARMPVEVAILLEQQCLDHGRGDALQRHPQAVLAVAGQGHAQQFAVLRQHHA